MLSAPPQVAAEEMSFIVKGKWQLLNIHYCDNPVSQVRCRKRLLMSERDSESKVHV